MAEKEEEVAEEEAGEDEEYEYVTVYEEVEVEEGAEGEAVAEEKPKPKPKSGSAAAKPRPKFVSDKKPKTLLEMMQVSSNRGKRQQAVISQVSSSRALVVVASLFAVCLAALFADTAVLCLCAGRARHWQIGEGGAREEQEGEHKQPARWEEGDRRGQGEQRHREAAHPARQEQQVLKWNTMENGVEHQAVWRERVFV